MTEYFFIYEKATGQQRMKGHGDAGITAQQDISGEFGAIMVGEQHWVDKTLAECPIEMVQDTVWEAVKKLRSRVTNETVTTPYGVFDIDANRLDRTSRIDIIGAASLARFALIASQPFSITFTAADNSRPVLDATAMATIGDMMANLILLAHDHARMLKDAIYAAETVADVLKIDIGSGWPS